MTPTPGAHKVIGVFDAIDLLWLAAFGAATAALAAMTVEVGRVPVA
ncbi:MAG: hypothetical protein AABZ33_12030 [Chloroflexota bacterium]